MSFFSKFKSSIGLSSAQADATKPLGIDLGAHKASRQATPEVDFWADFVAQIDAWRQLEHLSFHNEANLLLNKHFPKSVVIELEGKPQESNVRLVFSSNGEIEHFPAVMRLAHSAPVIDGFSTCAFRQSRALNEDMVFSMGEVTLHIGELLAQYSADGARIGLTIAFNKPIPTEQADIYKNLAFILLDHLLGEWLLAVKVGFIEFIESAEHFDNNIGKVMPLAELPAQLNDFWQKDLGHSGDFPKGENSFSMLSARGQNQDPSDEEGNIIIAVNRSANSVACRADLMYQLRISGMLDDKDTVNHYYDLEERFSLALNAGEHGIFAYRIVDMGEGHWTMIYYVQVAEMAQAIAQALVLNIFPKTSPVSVEYELDPRWLGYLQFA